VIIDENALSEVLHGIDVSEPADLLDRVRRGARRRRNRILVVGAPLGVGVLTAGAVFGVNALSDGGSSHPDTVSVATDPTTSASPIPISTPTPSPGPTVRLYHHVFDLPSGWTGDRDATHHGVNQGTSYPQGGDEELDASGPDGAWFDITEYRGALADAEYGVASGVPDETHDTTIAGSPATADVFGTSPVCTWTIPVTAHSTTTTAGDVGTCPHTVVGGTAGAVSINVAIKPGDSLLVEAGGISVHDLKAILAAAIR
jgi:hypothetical protein